MIHCTLCDKSFATIEAYEAHCVSAGAHKKRYCDSSKCSLGRPLKFATNVQFEEHMRKEHVLYSCTPCGVESFGSYVNLQRHFRAVNIHPNCTMCAEGMELKEHLEKHMRVKHPQIICIICGTSEYVEKLQEHYLESAKHPKCVSCNIGFETEEKFAQHEHRSSADAPPKSVCDDDKSNPTATKGETMATHLQQLLGRESTTSALNLPHPDSTQDSDDDTTSPIVGSSSLPDFNLQPQRKPSEEFQIPLTLPSRGESVLSPSSIAASSKASTISNLHGSALHSPLPDRLQPLSPVSDSKRESSFSAFTGLSSYRLPNEFAQRAHSPALHCRLCQANPCIMMTSTFCGHIFCNRCITTRLINTPYCPVCDAANLLYMIFKIDLSA